MDEIKRNGLGDGNGLGGGEQQQTQQSNRFTDTYL